MTKPKKKESVIVAMSGRMDSTVTAYLLKNQGFNVIGVTLQFYGDEKEVRVNSAAENDDDVEFINLNPIKSDCHIEDLNQVKKICDVLEIPHYVVAAKKIFEDKILEYVVSAKIEGSTYAPCVYCNRVKLDILLEKADKLGVKYLATGHYGKIHWEAKSREYHVYSSSDAASDQSYFLSQLSQEHLSRMILPLSEMRVVDVEKMATLINYKFNLVRKKKKMCFMENPKLNELVESRTAESLRKEGGIYRLDDQSFVADHAGVHHHHIGEVIKLPEGQDHAGEMSIVKIKSSSHNIYIDYVDRQEYEYCSLDTFWSANCLNQSLPINAFVKMGIWEDYIPVIVYFKNNKRLVLEFCQMQKGALIAGELAVLFSSSTGGRIIGTGRVNGTGKIGNIIRAVESRPTEEKDIFSIDKVENEDFVKQDFDF